MRSTNYRTQIIINPEEIEMQIEKRATDVYDVFLIGVLCC